MDEEQELEGDDDDEFDEIPEDAELGDIAGDYDLEAIADELEPEEESSDDEPVIELPNLSALRADKDCATRLFLIENTEHVVQCDQ